MEKIFYVLVFFRVDCDEIWQICGLGCIVTSFFLISWPDLFLHSYCAEIWCGRRLVCLQVAFEAVQDYIYIVTLFYFFVLARSLLVMKIS